MNAMYLGVRACDLKIGCNSSFGLTSSQEQLKWDLAMLKCQVTSFSYGIPGESKCFQCSEELKHFNSIAERFNHQFNYHGEQILVNDLFISIFLPFC